MGPTSELNFVAVPEILLIVPGALKKAGEAVVAGGKKLLKGGEKATGAGGKSNNSPSTSFEQTQKQSSQQITENKNIDNVSLLLPSPTKTGSARRYEPGVASYGDLPTIQNNERWLKGTSGNAGKVPTQIAQQLAGKKFKTFDDFRAAFWKAAANDPVLSKQFLPGSLNQMKQGKAPFVKKVEKVGKRVKYELDHMQELQHGGNVYDMNNIIIRTPLNHIKGK